MESNGLEEECIAWLAKNYPNEGLSQNTGRKILKTHIDYIQRCMRKKERGLGYWDDSPRFFDETFGALMSKTMYTAVYPEEDRFLNVRDMMHLVVLPQDCQLDVSKNIKANINCVVQVIFNI